MQEPTFRRRFGRALKAAREAADLTQNELSERANIASKYLSRLEGGLATPSLFVASRLSKALGISLDSLVGATEHPEGAKLTAVFHVLHRRSGEEIDRALRVVRELFR